MCLSGLARIFRLKLVWLDALAGAPTWATPCFNGTAAIVDYGFVPAATAACRAVPEPAPTAEGGPELHSFPVASAPFAERSLGAAGYESEMQLGRELALDAAFRRHASCLS